MSAYHICCLIFEAFSKTSRVINLKVPLAIAIEWVWYMHLCVMKVSHIYKSRGEKHHLTRHIISIVKHHKHSKCVLIKKPIFQRRRQNMIRMRKYFEEWHESEIFLLCCYIIVYQIQKLKYEIVYFPLLWSCSANDKFCL